MFHLVTISKTTLCDARPIQNAGQPLKGALALPDVCEAAVGSTRVPGRTAALFERQSVSVSVSLKDVVVGMCLSPLVQYVRFSLSLLGVRFRVMGFGFRAAGSRA